VPPTYDSSEAAGLQPLLLSEKPRALAFSQRTPTAFEIAAHEMPPRAMRLP
jgi:hypothetical protein